MLERCAELRSCTSTASVARRIPWSSGRAPGCASPEAGEVPDRPGRDPDDEQRYSTLEFRASAAVDEGDIWPVGFAIVAWFPEVQEKVTELVARAVS